MRNNFYIYLYLDPRRSGRFEYNNFNLLFEPFMLEKEKIIDYLTQKQIGELFNVTQQTTSKIKIKNYGNIDEEIFHYVKRNIK